ncbi:MAG: hypothetical protein SFY32_10605 [Bacteroidota bacterium]|nr:hypothetical protein [Bacteroidota bacterium]
MKRYLLCAFILIFTISFAQKVKYKDVFEIIMKGDKVAAFPLLKTVLKTDSSNASANLQLGIIFHERAITSDPLKQTEAAIGLGDSALYYLKRANRLINEKEIRKNDDYYVKYSKSTKDTTKKVKDNDTIVKRVKNHITKMTTELSLRKTALQKISNAFKRGTENYIKALIIYQKLNETYATQKELCLLATDEEIAKLRQLAQAFDSTLAYFQLYKKGIKEYPIPPYNQSFDVISVETYRIDGLVKSDFLANKVLLWNFSEWAKTQILFIDTDIKKIKRDAVMYDTKYNKLLEQIQAGNVNPDSVTASRLDNRFERLLNKYDFNSLALNWLTYKQNKNEFAAFTLNRLNSVENTSTAQLEAKASYYSDMVHKVNVCDSALTKMTKLNLNREYPKYKFLLAANYPDTTVVKNYFFNERQFVNFSQKEYNNRYMQMMYNYLQKYNDTLAYISYNNQQVPFFKSYTYSHSEFKTMTIKEDKKGNVYLGGYKGAQAFIAKMNEFRQIMWLKLIPAKLAGSLEMISAIDASENVCVAILNGKAGNFVKNVIVKFDATGNETYSKPVEPTGICRGLVYDEVNDNCILVSKGSSIQDYSEGDENTEIFCADNTGNIKWRHKITLNGSIVDLNRVFEGYLVVANYANASTIANTIQSKAGTSLNKSNILLLKITTQGEIRAMETIASATPLYAVGCIKVSSSAINIVGINGDFLPGWVYRKDGLFPNKILKVVNSNLEFR